MTSPEALPELYQAELDDDTLAALFNDLGQLGSELEVSVKEHAHALTAERSSWTLAQAQRALIAGELRALQVRYVHEGAIWIDTVLRRGGSYRVVRMQSR